MTQESKTIAARQIPGLAALAREVRDTREPVRIIGDGGEELAVIQPALTARESLRAKTSRVYTDPSEIPTLTKDEAQVALQAIRDAAALREQIRTAHGGKPLPPSWPIIRAAREARSRQL